MGQENKTKKKQLDPKECLYSYPRTMNGPNQVTSEETTKLLPHTTKKKTKKCFVVVLFAVGISLLLMALLIDLVLKKIVDVELHANLPLKPGNTERFEQWKFPTVPVRIQFYLFNVVNPDEVSIGATPVVEEVGPYTYREFLLKTNISFDEEDAQVSYNQKKWFTFVEDLSCNNCNPFADTVTTVNVPYAIMLEVAKGSPELVKIAIDGLLLYEKETLFMTRTVQEIIWGYNDPMFAELSKLKKKFPFLPDISPVMNLEYNETFDGIVTAFTGSKELKRVLSWESWKGKKSVGLWNTTFANMINGSDGTQFPPGTTPRDILYFFSTNLCRSIYLTFDKKDMIKGIDVYRFTTPSSLFENFTYVPSNREFCLGRCYPNGILAGSRDCQPSYIVSPIVISTPHFLIGDKYLKQQVMGLTPNKTRHGLFISVEPITGIPLQALIRLQINVFIQPVTGILETKQIKQAFLPVMWFSNNATVDEDTAKLMRDDIILPLKICFGLQVGGFSLGGLLVFIGILITVIRMKKSGYLKRFSKKKASVQFENENKEVKGENTYPNSHASSMDSAGCPD